MKNIRFYQLFAFVITLFVFVACGNEPSSGTAEAAQTDAAGQTETGAKQEGKQAAPSEEAPSDSDITFEADPSFQKRQVEQYAKIIQGKWHNTATPDFAIEFSGNKMKTFNAGVLQRESEFEVDPDCKNSECQGALGWCFIEKAKDGDKCNAVVRVDMKNLVFTESGSSTKQAFKKLN